MENQTENLNYQMSTKGFRDPTMRKLSKNVSYKVRQNNKEKNLFHRHMDPSYYRICQSRKH